jgi:N6-adenosine-specific RNA methylase IME4
MESNWPFRGLEPLHYGCILADPPWRMKTWSEMGRDRLPDAVPRHKQRENNAERHYKTMTLEEIQALPVGDLSAPHCVLALWAVDALLPEAIETGRRWGFTFKTVLFYWAKTRREGSPRHLLHDEPEHKLFPIGTGYWTRTNPEQCLLFTRGQPKRKSAAVRKLIIAPRREHSRKPDVLHERIEQLVDGPYIELFSRRQRPGWDSWGNEIGRFNEEAA